MRIKNIFVIFLIIFFLLFSFIFLFYIFTPTPTLDSIQNIKSERSIKLFDRNDVFLYDLSKTRNGYKHEMGRYIKQENKRK